ncbi:MAG: agmatinase [Candidatus Saganbacteria bacterium]|nr:agmatinase [Candidatus Saganbacteria bacterium]
MVRNFLDLEKKFSSPKTSQFVVIPCPHETTVSYGKGTKYGPQAIIDASKYLEEFDEELHHVTYKKVGVHTTKTTKKSELIKTCLKVLKSKKIPIVLGGEHSISPEVVKAAKAVYPDLSVLHFDAHADLDDIYEGSKQSHACAARRMLEICPVVSVGIRNISEAGYKFAKESKQIEKIHFGNNLLRDEDILAKLSNTVFISFDVDVFDPSIMPSTGTPEPGGLLWKQIINLLKKLCKEKKVIGADFVELAPIESLAAPDFMIAKLIYKLMGYIL